MDARAEIEAWFGGRLPESWFTGVPEISVDREEILVVGTIPDVDAAEAGDARAAARAGRIQRFRDETREERMRIAREAERRYGRKVSWGVRCGDERELFTTLSLPVMTRLRMPERAVLDTLVDAGVARSRSHALAWCVALVAQKRSEWLDELRDALKEVRRVRDAGVSEV